MLMNKKMPLTTGYIVVLCAITLLIGFVAGTRSSDVIGSVGPLLGLRVTTDTLNDRELQEAYQTLKTRYNGKLDDRKLLDGAIAGMVSGAGDPYTVYLNSEEAEEFNNELSGDIGGGIGAEISERREQPTVIRVLPGNPAEREGLKAGDVIVRVNDEITNGYDAEKAVRLIRGEPETTVRLTVRRGEELKEFSITRKVISNPSVSSELEGNTGTLIVSRFDEETVALVRKEADSLKRRGMKKVILDLRGDGGGYLDAAPGVAGLWLDSKLVTTIKGSTGGEDKLTSEGEPILNGMKTVVLVNEGTASAAEIVTAALKHYDAAEIVGQKTFGKGTVQELVPLSNGTLLKVTIKRWHTPSGGNVNEKGIKPDVEAALTQKDQDRDRDPQLDAAMKVLDAS